VDVHAPMQLVQTLIMVMVIRIAMVLFVVDSLKLFKNGNRKLLLFS
jgi:hypothetical protein